MRELDVGLAPPVGPTGARRPAGSPASRQGGRARLKLSILVLLFLPLGAGPADAGDPVTLRNVRIATSAAEPPGLSRIRIEGERIVSVEPEHDGPADGRVIDGRGAYASPGLWDMHIHALADADAAAERVLPLLVAHGVTGIRDMGSTVEAVLEVRARLAANPHSPHPRIVAAGPLLDGQALPWYGELPLVLTDSAEVPEVVERLKDQGMDLLKIYSDLAPDVLDAIAREGRARGLPIAGHVTRRGGLQGAARARQSSVEHLSVATFIECLPEEPGFYERWAGARFREGYDVLWELVLHFEARADWSLCESRLAELAAAGTAFTPTLAMEYIDRERTDLSALAWLDPRSREWCERNLAQAEAGDPLRRDRVYAAYGRMLARVRSAGLPILAGTDAPNLCLAPGASLISELERLVEAGLTPAEAVASATTAPARLFGRSHDMGRLAEGYLADILLTPSNPFADIAAYREISLVIAAGRPHDGEALAAMRERARFGAPKPVPGPESQEADAGSE